MKKELIHTYRTLADTYANEEIEDNLYNILYERPAMMKLVPENLDGCAVLDAGCSAGWYLEEMLKRGADVSGLDLNEKMVELSKERLGDQADIRCLDLEKQLPYEDHSFDLIVSSLTLHYLKDWAFTFREFHRVMKPGGMLLFSVHHPFSDFTLFKREDYFKRELLNDVWEKKAGKVEIQFYRRPLEEIVGHVTDQFLLDALVEPRPLPEMKRYSEKAFHFLNKNPHFLIVQAKKCKAE
ncbi:class I SAM-dependent methyltransferase [Bacillus testis]|uniref:class I SAM-dependent methyltransferase n=1 Tax=Bacillus testis TaxID=1622072 RepID=UPI00067F6EE0|nr:class I SAM-dependent methyltransferase [Bacillus testis]